MTERAYGTRALHRGTLDLDAGQFTPDEGDPVSLTWLELKLLRYLDARAGAVVPVEQLHADVWGYAPTVRSRAADKTASRLRQKLERDSRRPDHLLRLPGEGLRFRPLPGEAPAPAPPVPDPDGPLIGRAAEMAAVLAHVQDHVMVNILGPGGVGKTRLAGAVARSAPWPAVTVDLVHCRTADGAAAAVGAALGLRGGASEAVGAALGGRGPTLLVIDHVEHIVDAAPGLIGAWLEAAPELRILATSRRPLGMRIARRVHLGGLAPADGVALFRARVAAQDVSDNEVIAQISTRLEGLPLALEMAAARARVLTPAGVLAQLDQRFRLLRSADRDRPERHHSLWATLAWSWDLLESDARQVLGRAVVFRDPFTLDDAQAVLFPADTWLLDTLQELVEASLVKVIPGDGPARRFALAESVRAFAVAQQPGLSGLDVSALQERCARWAAGLARATLADDADDAARSAAAAHVETLADIAGQAVDPALATQCARGAVRVLRWRGPLSRARALAEQVLDRPDLGPADRVELYACVAQASRMAGDWDVAEAACVAALDLVDGLERLDLQVDVHTTLGIIALERADLDTARHHLEAAHAVPAAPGTGRLQATLRENLGFLAFASGDAHGAEVHYEAALDGFLRFNYRVGEGSILDKLASLAWARGDLARSRRLGERALAVHREVGNRTLEAICQGNLGTLHQLEGRHEAAMVAYSDALRLHEAQSNAFGEAITVLYVCGLERELGDLDAAWAALHRGQQLAARLGSDRLRGRALVEEALLTSGPEAAARLLDRAIPVLGAAGDPTVEGIAIAERGRLALGLGDRAMAVEQLGRVQALARRIGAGPGSRVGRAQAALEAALD